MAKTLRDYEMEDEEIFAEVEARDAALAARQGIKSSRSHTLNYSPISIDEYTTAVQIVEARDKRIRAQNGIKPLPSDLENYPATAEEYLTAVQNIQARDAAMREVHGIQEGKTLERIGKAAMWTGRKIIVPSAKGIGYGAYGAGYGLYHAGKWSKNKVKEKCNQLSTAAANAKEYYNLENQAAQFGLTPEGLYYAISHKIPVSLAPQPQNQVSANPNKSRFKQAARMYWNRFMQFPEQVAYTSVANKAYPELVAKGQEKFHATPGMLFDVYLANYLAHNPQAAVAAATAPQPQAQPQPQVQPQVRAGPSFYSRLKAKYQAHKTKKANRQSYSESADQRQLKDRQDLISAVTPSNQTSSLENLAGANSVPQSSGLEYQLDSSADAQSLLDSQVLPKLSQYVNLKRIKNPKESQAYRLKHSPKPTLADNLNEYRRKNKESPFKESRLKESDKRLVESIVKDTTIEQSLNRSVYDGYSMIPSKKNAKFYDTVKAMALATHEQIAAGNIRTVDDVEKAIFYTPIPNYGELEIYNQAFGPGSYIKDLSRRVLPWDL